MNKTLIIAALATFSLFACRTEKQHIEYWAGRTIEIDSTLPFTVQGLDTVQYDQYFNSPYKMLVWADSLGCTSCQLQLDKLKEFVEFTERELHAKLPVLLYLNNKDVNKMVVMLRTSTYKTPVYIDNNTTSKLADYKFSKNPDLNVFLLDSTNKVVVIGYPIHNEKIKDLYFKKLMKSMAERN